MGKVEAYLQRTKKINQPDFLNYIFIFLIKNCLMFTLLQKSMGALREIRSFLWITFPPTPNLLPNTVHSEFFFVLSNSVYFIL